MATTPLGQSVGAETLQTQAAKRSDLNARKDFRAESIYFVITDRFVDGDTRNNKLHGDEYAPGDLFLNQGGDFKGLMANLDHIQKMGFTAIWITPPVLQPPGAYFAKNANYRASGYHGYWAWDFSKVDPHLESPGATYDDLIRACHARGLKIIQDVVCNHGHGVEVGAATRWKDKSGYIAGNGEELDFHDDRRNFFHHDGQGLYDLMDFRDDSPEVLDWLSRVYEKWQDRGIDAFRIDTVGWMKPTFWAGFTDRMHRHRSNFFMFGEAWTNSDFAWLASFTRLPGTQGSPMQSGMSMLDMPGSGMGGWGRMENVFKGGDYQGADEVLRHDSLYRDPTWLVTFLDNHDKPRFNGNGDEGSRQATVVQAKDALNWYFTARGIPCVYYGTEVLLQGGSEPDNRRMLGQSGIRASRSHTMALHLAFLNKIRASSAALQGGTQHRVQAGRDHYVFRRHLSDEDALVLLNKGDQPLTLVVPAREGKWFDLVTGEDRVTERGTLTVTVPAHDVRIVSTRKAK
ncbi:MAG: alpha-glucosidase C-terminal domain-containing protein [Candidatus Sericytochromatia bacterium]|nr:alpha-glucosidase C-terminal domain-containing protein [Candidatus Tanganyikabacteria bacterium]